MMDYCYTAIGVFHRREFIRRTGASIGKSETRPLRGKHILPVLSTGARRGVFYTQPKLTSYFQIRHKGLAMLFSYQEAIG